MNPRGIPRQGVASGLPLIKGDGKRRVCLKCDKGFRSTGPGNRRYQRCSYRMWQVASIPEKRGKSVFTGGAE